MSKRLIRVLSLILTLVMFMSVSTQAFALGGGGLGDGWDRPIGEDEIRDFDGPVEEEEEPTDYFSAYDEQGLAVTVEAPMGALPTLAEVRAERVEAEDIRDAVDAAVDGNPQILLAVDISFWLYGQEIEPEQPVRVKIAAPELENKYNLTLVHIPDAADPETIELIDEKDLKFALGSNEIAFESDSFSTYVITWGEEPDKESATVHWGEVKNGAFEDFDMSNVVTLDTSADVINLAVDFEGKAYNGAYYIVADTTDHIVISPTLKKVEGKWQVETHVFNAETGKDELAWTGLGNGDNIYVEYAVPQSTPGAPTNPDQVPVPDTRKNVTENADGTRTITLDVTGTKVSEDHSVGANVLILLDRTASMSYRMSGNKDRMDVAKDAIDTLVTALTTGENAANDVQFALLDFYVQLSSGWFGGYSYSNADRLHSWSPTNGSHQSSGSNYWNSFPAVFNQYIQNDSYSYPNESTATNWESPLVNARTILNTRDNDTTYVIFVTDGEPNCCGTTSISTNYIDYYNLQAATALTAMSTTEKPIKFYGVMCGNEAGSTAYNRLNTLITNAGGVETVDGSSEDDMIEAFGKIAQTIIDDLYANNVSVDDGIPSLSSVSSGVVEGGVGGYEYYKVYPLTAASGGSYTYKVGDETKTVTAAQVSAGKDADGNLIYQENGQYFIEVKWTENVAGASYNESNGVTWNLSSVNVQPGVTYRLKFKVWPSQEAYDYIADLNNGLIDPVPSEDELKKMGINKNDEGVYYLVTNNHLKTTYTFGDQTYEDVPYGDDELPSSAMILPTTTITITKIWNNELDARAASNVSLSVTKDGEPYLYDDEDAHVHTGIPMSGATQTGDHQWTQVNNTPIYISMGQLTLDTSTNDDGTIDIEVISSGHDYTVEEPENFSYNWELTADNYHPMVINGTPTVLIEVTKEAKAALDDDDVKNLGENKHITKGGKDYYAFNGKLYVAKSGSNTLTAINDRRSNLNLTKTVEAAQGITAPEDALFTFTATITYPKGEIEPDVWFAIQEPDKSYIRNGDFDVNDYVTGGDVVEENVKTMDTTYTNVVFHAKDDTHHYDYYTYTRNGEDQHARAADNGTGETHKIYTGFYHLPHGNTVTLKLRAGWNVRFTNMPNDTTYEFVETVMPDGFVFKTAEGATDNGATPGALVENTQKVTGTIDKPNNQYTVTYTNTCVGVFYVYHSADNTVQRFPMAVNGVAYSADNPFDINALTKDDTLYGGYYKDYAGKSEGFDVTALTFTENAAKDEGTDAKIYGYQEIKDGLTWDWDKAYAEDGTAMVPVSNTVYFLKEVPDGYLSPYTHYTYFVESKNIGTMWTITGTDDLLYKACGFLVKTDNLPAIMVESMTITPSNYSQNTVTLEASKIFRTKGVLAGMLGYADITEYLGNETLIQMYWTTRDGVTVFGKTQRTLTYTGTKITDLKKTDAPYTPPENP